MDKLDELAAEIRGANRGNGWNVTEADDWDASYKIPAVLALIHSEVSEALEAFRKDDPDNFMEELADIQIRLLDLAGAFTEEFTDVVERKVEINRGRGYRHGGKRI
jgi:NTP pyrophosphatase (non-canonical NTP hydrolase)